MNKKILIPLIATAFFCVGCGSGNEWVITQKEIPVLKTDEEVTVDVAASDEGTEGKTEANEGIEDGNAGYEGANESIPEDVIFFMGQSNMCGYGGTAELAPKVSEEAGAEFRAISDPTRLYPIEEPFGANENNPDGLQDKPGLKRGSLASSFINRYHDRTGARVIAGSISVGGMAMDLWLIDKFNQDVQGRIRTTIEWLNNNGHKPRHVYALWLQGESDTARYVDANEYKAYFDEFMQSVIDSGVEKIFVIIPASADSDSPGFYTGIYDMQKQLCEERDEYVLATDYLETISRSCYVDGLHIDQDTLNIVGEKAADGVAAYVLEEEQFE